jgi:spermidine synthase
VPTLVVLLGIAPLAMLAPARNEAALLPGEILVEAAETPYQQVSVIDNKRRNARDLRFDRFVESSISLTPPHQALADYTDYFHLAFLLKPQLKRTVFIGAGGAIGPRAFHMHDPQMEIDVVDIDPKVLQIAREHFFLQDDPRIRTIAQDGRMFLEDADEAYDCVVLDAFTIGGRIPFHLVTKEFLELCRQRMTDGGVFIMNINSAIEGPNSRIFHSMQATIEAVFPTSYVFAKDHRLAGRENSTNIVLVATRDEVRLSDTEWSYRADRHRSASYISRAHLRRCTDDLLTDLPELSQATPFTDDYAPIETMPF